MMTGRADRVNNVDTHFSFRAPRPAGSEAPSPAKLKSGREKPTIKKQRHRQDQISALLRWRESDGQRRGVIIFDFCCVSL